MTACPSCGRENADDARFCSACGTALIAPEPAREQRKVVTVLFCDLVGSTALGESTDPEALRARMRRYFEDLRAILERHGGSVEKFVGDAVMAVFGIPVSHEDDALRAVRAAAEMRAAIAEHGLEARIGVNTGEVVVGGEGETLVTGDAVNVAARLEQAAPNGEILIGGETRVLVRDAVRVERSEPLALKGKSEAVQAYRLLELVGEESVARRLDTPLVGRERERQRLWRAYEDAVADTTCQLFTLLGPAGIGKSRLVADFLERVGDSAEIHRGRCLSYGEGITYWPLVEILVAIGVDPASIIGTSPPETQLSFRRLLEARAAERPQVVVIDDLQWAEPVFVDLVEHVADLSRDAPIFLLCIARTELLDTRPDWGGGKLNATSLLLEPLAADECGELMDRLSDVPLADELRERIAAASAGNPLYVEEMLAMVREQGGDGEIAVPPTIHALLQARIDSLDGDVRVVMERGAVEGEVFHRGAVAVLSPEPVRDDVSTHLTTLVRKELIRSTSPTFPDDEGFRFRHLLIRDAAYESLPKATRAELHERFADWLATHDLLERDEVVGYHLEQAHRYRAELDPGDTGLAALARRASERLEAAGRAATDRGDHRAGSILLGRAVSILAPDDPRRHELAPELALALQEAGEIERAYALVSAARASEDGVVAALADVVAARLASVSTGVVPPERRASLKAALGVLETAGHDDGVSLSYRTLAAISWGSLRAGETLDAFERALERSLRAGRAGRIDDLVWWMRAAYTLGPTPVGEALERTAALDALVGSSVVRDADADAQRARLLAMQGDIAHARELLQAARETYLAAGLKLKAGMALFFRSWVDDRSGDLEALEHTLRTAMAEQHELGAHSYSRTIMGHLALRLYERGCLDEARTLSRTLRAETAPGDLANVVFVDALDAALLAREGRIGDARVTARRALDALGQSDFYFMWADALLCSAEVESIAGAGDEAAKRASEAVALTDAKGDVTLSARLRRRFAELGIVVR